MIYVIIAFKLLYDWFLSLLILFSDPEYKFKVPRTNFFPQPNVSD